MTAHEHDHEHHHGHVHLDEADWSAMAAQTELQGEVLLRFVTDAAAQVAALRDSDVPPVRRIVDIGSGPGVGTCELARLFPEADVVAVDSSAGMLERAVQRAAARGLGARVTVRHAELPGGLDGLAPVDVIWASMSLHHVGDEVRALRALHAVLDPHGLVAIAEFGDPTRVLPDDLDVGRPGFAERLDRAGAAWFARMRGGLTDSVPSASLPSMLASAGFEMVFDRLVHVRLDAPLSDDARRFAQGYLHRSRDQFAEHLDDDDRQTLAVLASDDDPRGVMRRPDVLIAASQQIVIARRAG